MSTARIGWTLALASVLMVLAALSSSPASGETGTSYFCTDARPKVIREIKGKTATAGWRSKKFCVKMGMRSLGVPFPPGWPIEGPDWPIIIPGTEPPPL